MVEEGAGGAAPLSSLIILLVGSRFQDTTSHIYDGGQNTCFHGEHRDYTCKPDGGASRTSP